MSAAKQQKRLVRPCPFCGEAYLETDETTGDNIGLFAKHPHGIHIRCETCGARGPCFQRPTHDDEVLGAWNHRKHNAGRQHLAR